MTKHSITMELLHPLFTYYVDGALSNLLTEPSDLDNQEMAALVAQCAVECPHFRPVSESLNYTPSALRTVFGMRTENANFLGRSVGAPAKQREIANMVYNGRMGNRLHSNDGWVYRGRGLIQLTGRNNYTRYGTLLGYPLTDEPDIANETRVAAQLALAYWRENKLGDILRVYGIRGVSRKINRGTHLATKPALHEEERSRNYERIMEALDE